MPQPPFRSLPIVCILTTTPLPNATAQQQTAAPTPQERLWDAAMAGDTSAMADALAQGTSVDLANRTGFTPLHHAAEHGSAEAAATLLRLGADPERRNDRGERPVDVARMHRREDLVILLEGRSRR